MTNEELLRDEYLAILKAIEDFDTRAVTIKAWSVTVSAAGLAAAYSEKVPGILILAAASAVIFWFVEALWKASQSGYYPRFDEIERHFRDGTAAHAVPFQISASRAAFLEVKQKERRALGSMFWPHIAFPHLPVALLGALLYFLHPPAM